MFPRTNRTELTCGSSYVGISPEIKMVQSDHAGVIQLQGPKDRILYHSLKPQDNIQTVRLKLWARVRKYDEATDEWSMQTLVMPTEKTDWWHARLHFKSRD